MNKSRTNSDELTITCGSSSELLNQARVEALDGTAQAIKKIRRQYELAAAACDDECLNQIEDAASSAEDAMFYLASAASDDDDRRLSEILASYGLESIVGDSVSDK